MAAHADIALQREDDPDPPFPWQALAARGIDAWPGAQRTTFYLARRTPHTPIETTSLLDLLSRYGHEVKPRMAPRGQQQVIMTLQIHFRSALWNDVVDAETQAVAEVLLGGYEQG